MNNLIIGLYVEIVNLIKSSEVSKINELRFKIGETISVFYAKNMKSFKKDSAAIEEAIFEFYKNKELKQEQLETDKYKKSASWDKIKTALSNALGKNFSGEGYSTTNLGYMQQFYRMYRNLPDSLDLAFQLDWSHNVELLKDTLNEDERKYYLKNAVNKKWSLKELQQQIQEESFDDFLRILEESEYKYKIVELYIKNYKSLESIKLDNLSRFIVFAGANASGKSNILEALEFLIHSSMTTGNIALDIFGGGERILNFNAQKSEQSDSSLTIKLNLQFEYKQNRENLDFGLTYDLRTDKLQKSFTDISALDARITESYSRIFIGNNKRAENKLKLYNKLWLDASNLNRILKTILNDSKKKHAMTEWLQALIPGIERIEVVKSISGNEELQIFEKAFPNKPITGGLISEGTFNIIALLALFYQNNRQQFICIEEPEIGLNPAILKELVSFFREMSEKHQHHIWITTHSTSLVSELYEEELVIVTKKEGVTNVYPCQEGDFEKMRPDEAWMSNMLKGGGLPW